MILDGIDDGDLAIVKHASKAMDGQTVVAIMDDGEATLKRFAVKGKMVTLTPANDSMKPIKFARDRVAIRGVLVGAVRMGCKRR